MPKPPPAPPRPTDAELAILTVLWRRGPSTVRDVHEQLLRERPRDEAVAYTTVLKLLQIMTDKGIVLRGAPAQPAARSHVYRPAVTEERTQRQLVGDLLDRAFGGSATKLVVQALSARKASPKELAEVRRLIDEMKGTP